MQQPAKSTYEFGPFRLDPAKRVLLKDGEPVPLTPKAFEVLLLLVESHDHVVGKDEFWQRLWPDSFVEEGNLTVNISTLRKALGEHRGEHRYIVTVPGRGYQFVAGVKELFDEDIDFVAQESTRSHILIESEKSDELEVDEKRPLRSHFLRLLRSNRKPLTVVGICLTLLLIGLGIHAVNLSKEKAINSVAVLPITNRSADASIDYLSEGLTESLIRKLSRLSKLRVKAPTVVAVYKDQPVDPQKVGHDLNVDAVLIGTVTKQGAALVIQASLVSTADGALIWGGEYNTKADEIQGLQEELSKQVASNLRLSLSEDEKRLLASPSTMNREAHRLCWLGRHYWSLRDNENIQKAIQCFNQAIDLDPSYAQAHAGLADCYVLLSTVAYGQPLTTRDAMSKARYAATQAIQLDDSLCEAHTSLAMILLRYEWNWQEAENEFKRALHINPNYAPAHYWYSNLLAITGRTAECIAESETAQYLDPFSAQPKMNLGRAYYYARQYAKAADYLSNALSNHPDDWKLMYVLGFVYQQQGLYQPSIDLFEKLYTANKLRAAAALGYSYAKAGRRNDAQKILDELEELSRQAYVPQQEKALIYVGLGDKDQAFQLLQAACQEHFAVFPLLMIDPLLDDLRSDPRFADLARCADF